MVKKFELSTYGVEEMNQKELVDVEGGSILGWLIIAGILALVIILSGGHVYGVDVNVDVGAIHLQVIGYADDGLPIYAGAENTACTEIQVG